MPDHACSLPRHARVPSSIVLLLGLALGGCGTPRNVRAPTPEFLALSPQRIAVDDLLGAGSARENQVAAELARQLRELGYEVVAPGQPADATFRYALESDGSGREWYSGVASARVMVSLELRCPSGTVFEAHGLGCGTEEFADNEDDRHDLADVYLGWLVDGVADELDPPDYEKMYAIAVRSAVYDALREFPERLEPAARPWTSTSRTVHGRPSRGFAACCSGTRGRPRPLLLVPPSSLRSAA